MYDYIMIYSDVVYKNNIKTEAIEQFFVEILEFKKTSSLKFSKEVCNELVTATGILADPNGNYAFDTLDGYEEINLIEIVIPHKMTYEIEEEIKSMANAIANEFSWLIDYRE